MFLLGKGPAGKRTAHAAARSASDELQEQVYTLVRERLNHALGAGGIWNVTLRKAGDTETLFGETVAERLAWDVAARLTPLTGVAAATGATAAPGEPATFEPAATEPAATEPVTTEPVATEPAPTEPVATEVVSVEAIFVTPAVGAFGPPARVRVVVPTTYVGPMEWSKYGPPTLESLVASVGAPTPHSAAEDRASA